MVVPGATMKLRKGGSEGATDGGGRKTSGGEKDTPELELTDRNH